MANNKETIEKVTSKIIERIESGKLNWNKPWNGGALPQNYVSKRPYRGWNLFVTLFSEFESPYYLTFNQIKKLGGTIKKGSKGLPIIFWKQFTKDTKNADGQTETRRILMARDWTVFNAEQVEGINFKEIKLNQLGTCEDLENTIANMPVPVEITHSLMATGAYYTPALDTVTMPNKGQFNSTGEYYSVLVHEVIHSTGSKKRLNRLSMNDGSFDSRKHSYSYEELVAELGAAYLTAMYGISTEKTENNSAAYLQGWLKVFKADMQMLYKAAADAQKAVDYIINKKEEEAKEEED